MLFAVYKPVGPTCNDILNRIRKITGTRVVGHAGTLDPLASGVLVVGVGHAATKKLSTEVKKEKEYLATIKLGETSTTDDEEGVKTTREVTVPPSREKVECAVKKFMGKIMQTPPVYSAIKVAGQEAYKYARRGQAIKLMPREVEIKEIEILSYVWPRLELRVVTGPGVYIRSLARDIGDGLGGGGYLTALERIRVGDFSKKKAVFLADIASFLKNG